MGFDLQKPLDEVDWHILKLLQHNARLSYAEIGRQVGLTSPAVTERMRRLEESGIIEGYQARLNLVKIGLTMQAFVHVNVPSEAYIPFKQALKQRSEVLMAHHVTGGTAFVVLIGATSIAHLEQLVTQLGKYGPTQTFICLSTHINHRVVEDFS